MVGAYTALMYRLALPFARHRVSPNTLSALGTVWSFAALLAAWRAGSWTFAVAGLCVLSGLLDGLDGAVAALTNRATPLGNVVDSVSDRVSDSCFIAALSLLGARGSLVLLTLGSVALLEYTRARAGVAGLREVGVVTVGERPTRLVGVTIGAVAIGLSPERGAFVASGTAVVIAGLTVIAVLQLWWWLVTRWPGSTDST